MVKQKKLILRCHDDSVIIMSFILDDGRTVKRIGTNDEIEAEIAKMSTAVCASRLPIIGWQEIEDETILQDRTFRNAWRHKGQKDKLEVDMPHARELHREYLRHKRLPLLYPLDAEYRKAEEAKDEVKKAEIVARKTVLRDITVHPEIEAASTPEELKLAGMSTLATFKK